MISGLAMEPSEKDPLDAKTVKEEKKKPSLKEKLKQIKDNITLEPLLMFYVVPGALSRLATQNLNLEKACRVNLGYGDSVCDTLIARQGNKYNNEELEVQKLIASMEVWKNLLLTIIPSCLLLFAGAWSDRNGKRKALIVLPIVGDLMMCLSNIINVYYFKELPVQVTIFFEAFLPAITGCWVTLYMGVFSYIGDITSEQSRTFRVGLMNLCLSAGGPIGTALSGILLNAIGYYGVFSISATLYFISLLYGLLYIKDPKKRVQEKTGKVGCLQSVKDFFDIKHVKDTLYVGVKKGPNNRRMQSLLVFAAIGFIYGPGYGEWTIRYLFTRYRLNWDALKYSFYNTFYIWIHALGALISISLFSRHLKWHDAILGIISNVSHIFGVVLMGRAASGLQMYLAVFIEMFNATSYTALRSISSKLVPTDELGKMTSLFNLMEIVTSMVFGPLYSWLYMISVSVDAGIVFYLSAVLTVPAVLIFAWFYVQHRRSNKENDSIEAIESADLKENTKEIKEDNVELTTNSTDLANT